MDTFNLELKLWILQPNISVSFRATFILKPLYETSHANLSKLTLGGRDYPWTQMPLIPRRRDTTCFYIWHTSRFDQVSRSSLIFLPLQFDEPWHMRLTAVYTTATQLQSSNNINNREDFNTYYNRIQALRLPLYARVSLLDWLNFFLSGGAGGESVRLCCGVTGVTMANVKRGGYKLLKLY